MDGPLHDYPVRVFYRLPESAATAPVLIVMPGQQRDASRYRSEWSAALGARNVILVVPEFDRDEFSGSEAYNLGNMIDDDGHPRARSRWSFNIVEALFSYVVKQSGTNAQTYYLYGHSAGAQFVSRFMQFMPDNRVKTAVAANAGWYTASDNSVRFPYGLEGAPVKLADMGPVFRSDLVVLLGGDDVDENDSSLQRDHRTDAQGTNRLERGLNFFYSSRIAADSANLPFRWRLNVAPGVAHSDAGMAKVAASLLFPQ
jgi:pimeloyl-ACP methyl ester carboxylesterase